MGTRHLIAVQLDGQYKIAQYGQWDGYPDGQGVKVLRFIRDLALDSYAEFVAKVRATTFMTSEEIDALNADIAAGKYPRGWSREFPHISRDAGGEILGMVAAAAPGLKLMDRIAFAGDSLFCEWAWVIDLDKRTLEAYRGFNKRPVAEGERFHGWQESHPESDTNKDYQPVRFVTSWPLDGLPSDDQFLEAFAEPKEGEEEEAEAV